MPVFYLFLSSLSLIDGFTYIYFVQGRCASTIKLLVYHLSDEISIHAFVVVFTVMNRFLLELDYTRVSTEHLPILGLALGWKSVSRVYLLPCI